MDIHFEPLGRYNLEYIRILRNENTKAFLNQDKILAKDHYHWYNEWYKLNPFDCIWIIKDHAAERVGMISIYNINPIKKEAKIGRLIIEHQMRKFGFAQMAIKFGEKFAKNVFKIKTLYLEVRSSNKAAFNLYKKMGYKELSRRNRIIYMRKEI